MKEGFNGLSLRCIQSSTGWAVINRNKNILKYGKIVTKKDKFKSEDERMCYICNAIQELIITHNISKVLIETNSLQETLKQS
ncbi:hypothetical protein RHK18_20195 [Clostridioides difficile]|nr:hypothetical protein [Clostridioides difficile]MDW0050361.1 hypothetical protein [Clostridioides difficile]